MSAPTFDTVSTALTQLYGSAGSHVTVDQAAGRFTISEPGVAVDDLAAFVDQVVGDPNFVPHWIPHGLSLAQLDLRRDPDTNAFNLTFTVAASDEDWEVFDGFTIVGASLDVQHTAVGLWGKVAGTMHIDGMVLEVSVELPDQVVAAHLHHVDEADGARFLAHNDLVATGTSRQPVTTAKLQDASLYGSIPNHRFVLHVEATDLLDVDPFSLRACAADVQLGGENEVTLWVDIDLKLASGTIAVDLLGRVNAQGWAFTGHVQMDPGTTLADLAADVAALVELPAGPTLPPALGDCEVRSLSLSLDTAAKDVTFTCHLHWDADDVDAVVDLEHVDGTLRARGTLTVGKLAFDVAFDHGGATTAVVGAFRADGGVTVTLADLMSALGADDDTLGDLPKEFAFEILDAAIAYESGSKVLLAADMDVGVDLSGLGSLPVIGAMVPATDALKLGFRPVVSTAWTAAELDPVQQALPTGVPALPPEIPSAGARIDARLQLGPDQVVDLPLVDMQTATAQPATGTTDEQPATPASVTAAADKEPSAVTWHPVDKAFGPLHVSQVGVHVDQARRQVELLMGGSVTVAGLELSLMGLGARYGLDDRQLHFSLQGLGLQLRRPPIEVAGAFLDHDGELVGKVTIRTETFGLTALGAFGMVSGSPSMFLYGVLDTPIGGPPFFFVDGLAAGLGFNRAFVPPALDAVRSFPLVSDAAGSTTAPTSLDDQLERLHEAVPPRLGEYFLALGVKFTSFKLLESFVLLVVSFGEHVEIDLLGTSTYQTPPGDLGPVPPMARVDLSLVGRVAPAEGVVDIRAQLSPTSYVYDPLCHVTGGFAFAAWFAHAHEGDFVLSVGGYHPDWAPPAHYPNPPRVGIAYQVTPDVYVKGEGYFALTPSLFMAGAALEASAKVGAASASFRVAMDFLIGWEPYHYDIKLAVDVAAAWHCFHTSAHVSLHVWGPDFAGRAQVHWTVFSFDVTFGPAGSTGPVPVDFERFRDAFLPAVDDALSVRAAAGLVDTTTTAGGEDIWTIDPANFRLETSSILPTPISTGSKLGIAPMGLAELGDTAQTVTITRVGAADSQGATAAGATHLDDAATGAAAVTTSEPDDIPLDAADDVTHEFTIVGRAPTSFPSALWGTTLSRDLDDAATTASAGVVVIPKALPTATSSQPILRSELDDAPNPPVHHAPAVHGGVSRLPFGRSSHDDVTPAPDGSIGVGGVGARGLPWDRIRSVTSQGGLG